MVIKLIIVQKRKLNQEEIFNIIDTIMTDFKKEWTVESAIEILAHPTVDSKVWSEAVEWLMVYGPPEIQEMLQHASGFATSREFPELKAQGFTRDGQPVYSVADVAQVLNISEEEAAEIIAEKQQKHGLQQFFDEMETRKVQ